VFFKVFQRVSWWSFRVSTPFSFLCLIFLTDFRKKASFHPTGLNHLNTTFTFGKQTKDTFINRNSQCRPTYSFIHLFSCPIFLGKSRGGSSTRRTRNTSRSRAISGSSACSTPRWYQARLEM